jgi:hypothetical protein
MSQAIFALAGALVGVLGAVVAAMLQAYRLDRRSRHDALRTTCSEFAASIARVGHLSARLDATNLDPVLQAEIANTQTDARVQYERLRLLTESLAAQEAARYAIRHAYNMWMKRAGKDYRVDYYKDAKPSEKLDDCMTVVYREVRKELGVPQPMAVFPELRD